VRFTNHTFRRAGEQQFPRTIIVEVARPRKQDRPADAAEIRLFARQSPPRWTRRRAVVTIGITADTGIPVAA
jgi:hypothetical protein